MVSLFKRDSKCVRPYYITFWIVRRFIRLCSSSQVISYSNVRLKLLNLEGLGSFLLLRMVGLLVRLVSLLYYFFLPALMPTLTTIIRSEEEVHLALFVSHSDTIHMPLKSTLKFHGIIIALLPQATCHLARCGQKCLLA